MDRIGKQFFGRRFLHHLSQIHNGNFIGQMIDDTQIVSDKDIGKSHLLLQLLQEVDDLRLDGYIQCGYRLVTYDKFGIRYQTVK